MKAAASRENLGQNIIDHLPPAERYVIVNAEGNLRSRFHESTPRLLTLTVLDGDAKRLQILRKVSPDLAKHIIVIVIVNLKEYNRFNRLIKLGILAPQPGRFASFGSPAASPQT